MCGIVGIASKKNNLNDILIGLKSLEYRGYDSCGIAGVSDEKIFFEKSISKIYELEKKLNKRKIQSNLSIGHTRWATHGKPSIKNAHPIIKENCSIVHNGIIENFEELKIKYKIDKKLIISDTDTEIISLITERLLKKYDDPSIIIKKITKHIKGTYSFAIIINKFKNIFAVKKGSPLVVGLSKNYNALSSDVLGLPDETDEIIFLEDNDMIVMSSNNYKITNLKKKINKRQTHKYTPKKNFLTKGKFKHFMQKEIYYQPISIENTFQNYSDIKSKSIYFPKSNINFDQVTEIHFIGCGTALHACMIAKYWFEMYSKINVTVNIASEFRHKKNIEIKNSLGVLISQSGETMDTLKCLKYLKNMKIKTLSIVNVLNSSIARQSDYVLPTLAGPEISVASTKAFTSQLSVLSIFILSLQKKTFLTNYKNFNKIFEISKSISKILKDDAKIKFIAKSLINKKSIFYVGRGLMYPIALEGALKLKEITYKHCEGYAAGELKHGPLALIEHNTPVIVLAPSDKQFQKIFTSIQEIKARGGLIIIITDKLGSKKINKYANHVIVIPETNSFTSPLLYSIPIQLIAYHLAVFLGTNVDQPRNLAKSVTVE